MKEKAKQLSIAVALGEGRVVKNDIEEDVTGKDLYTVQGDMSYIHWSESRETPAALYIVVVSSITIFSGHWENEYKGDESFWQLLQKKKKQTKNIWDLNRKHCRNREGEAKLMKSATVLTRTAQEGWG